MKIAMFSENFYPELSGISDSLATIAQSLGSRGHEIHFFVPHYSRKNFAHIGLANKELELGKNVYIHRLFSFPFPGPTNQARLVIPTGFRTLAIKRIKPDIIHTHLFFGVGFEGLIAAKILGIPFLGTNHTPISEFVKYSPIHNKRFIEWSKRAVSWYYNRCDFVTAPSQPVLDEMKQYGFRKPNQVVSNPIRLDDFQSTTAEQKSKLKAKYGLGRYSVLYTGRLAAEKHLDVVLRAFALAKEKMPDMTLAITGRGQAERDLKQLAQSLGINQQVKFLGYLDQPSFVELYQASDVFAIASTAETQCIALMQALSSGVPAVVVNARALPENVKNDINGFVVEIGDYKEMANKILAVLSDEKLYVKLSSGAVESVKNFSIDKVTTTWEDLYTKVIHIK